MGLETINALGHPAMVKCPVQPYCRFLQLHSRPQAVRRARPATDEAVDLFLDVDERLFHAKRG